MTTSASLSELVHYADTELRVAEIGDWSNALNGLQVENSGKVTRIAAAVDACETTLRRAVELGADLLVVHHGLFWGGLQPVTGATARKLRLCWQGDLAVYSAHLPLDAHPTLGNNILLAEALGLEQAEFFLPVKGTPCAVRGILEMERAALQRQISLAIGGGPVHVAPGGPEMTRQVAIVTGGGGTEAAAVRALGIDTLITGEGPHHTYTLAEELGLNLFYAGHYATETFGAKALAARLSERFGVPWEFIDHPTGL
jgi:dinuclear metal center YbgI/SA1388 family protein